MTETQTLLAQYARDGSEAAFRELVSRYINLVYSTALRLVGGNAHLAEDVAQTVFTDLALKARTLPSDIMLGGWLHQHTRFVASKTMRGERRRLNRERKAAEMNAQEDHSQENLARVLPVLDEAISRLDAPGRTAILLRYFEQKDLGAVSEALGTSEEAARKRISRALDQLEILLKRRGVALSAAALGSLLAGQVAAAAPAGLATSIAGTALAGASAGATATLLEVLVMLKPKLALAGVILVAAVTTTAVLLHQSHSNDGGLSVQTSSETKALSAGSAAPQSAEGNGNAGDLLAEASDTTLREPFSPTVHITLDTPPGAAVVQSDGKIVIAATLSGFFVDEQSGVLGTYQRGAIRFQPDGSLDRSFSCQVNSDACDPTRAHLDFGSDGRMLMTGLFKSVDGKPRPGYAMLLSDGRVDESFEPGRGTTNAPKMTFLPGGVYPAALARDGSVAVMSTDYLLNPPGRQGKSADETQSPVEFPRPSGLVLTLGPVGFWARKPVDWSREGPATKRKFYFPDGRQPPVADIPFDWWNEPPTARQAAVVLKALFDETPLELCRYAARLPEGGVVMAVRYEAVNGAMSAGGRFMRFDKNWRPDFAFTNSYQADLRSCMTLKAQKDGKLLLAGLTGKVNGEEFPGLIRLETDGSIDRTFHCETAEQSNDRITDPLRRRVIGVAIQDDGRIVITGYFTKVNGVECQHIARLNPDGSLDGTFKTPFTTWEGLKAWRRVPVHRLGKAGAVASNASNSSSNAVAPPAASSQTVLIAMLEMQDGAAVVRFSGQPRQSYILQARDSLGAGVWSNVSTNQTGGDGAGIFRDEEAKKHSTRFYRIAAPY